MPEVILLSRKPPVGEHRLAVSGVSQQTAGPKLEAMLSQFGPVAFFELTEYAEDKCQWALVQFFSAADCNHCLQQLNGCVLDGRRLGVKRLPSEAPPGGGSAAAAAAVVRSAAESGGPLSAAHGIALTNRLGPTGWSHSVLSVRQCGLQEAGGSFEGQHVARVRVCVHSGDGPRRGKARARFVSS